MRDITQSNYGKVLKIILKNSLAFLISSVDSIKEPIFLIISSRD